MSLLSAVAVKGFAELDVKKDKIEIEKNKIEIKEYIFLEKELAPKTYTIN